MPDFVNPSASADGRSAPHPSVQALLDATAGRDGDDVAALRAELGRPAPDRAVVDDLVTRLRLDPHLGATIRDWWNAPGTQAFVNDLQSMGL